MNVYIFCVDVHQAGITIARLLCHNSIPLCIDIQIICTGNGYAPGKSMNGRTIIIQPMISRAQINILYLSKIIVPPDEPTMTPEPERVWNFSESFSLTVKEFRSVNVLFERAMSANTTPTVVLVSGSSVTVKAASGVVPL